MDGADFGGPNGFDPDRSETHSPMNSTDPVDLDFPLSQRQRALAWSTKEQDRWTRGLDIAISATALIMLSPLLLAIALVVRADRTGPALFRQRRYGRGGKCFQIYKFRTMKVMESTGAFTQARKNDPRVTWFGKFLRKSSLDELPQLLNVLKGDMSLVGPRPHPIHLDLQLAEQIPGYGNRFLTRPGITGLAQVRGFRGEIESRDDVRGRILNDILYARRRCVLLYMAIVLLTAIVVFFQSKAY
jgi:putative colanic acid biosynthesis UDP-glucose lipid carrier transferase